MTIDFQGNELVVALLGAFLLAVGLVPIFAKDFMWSWTSFNNRVQGQRSERTYEWELLQTIGGILTSGLGVLLLALTLGAIFNPPQQQKKLTLADCMPFELHLDSKECSYLLCKSLDSKDSCGTFL